MTGPTTTAREAHKYLGGRRVGCAPFEVHITRNSSRRRTVSPTQDPTRRSLAKRAQIGSLAYPCLAAISAPVIRQAEAFRCPLPALDRPVGLPTDTVVRAAEHTRARAEKQHNNLSTSLSTTKSIPKSSAFESWQCVASTGRGEVSIIEGGRPADKPTKKAKDINSTEHGLLSN